MTPLYTHISSPSSVFSYNLFSFQLNFIISLAMEKDCFFNWNYMSLKHFRDI